MVIDELDRMNELELQDFLFMMAANSKEEALKRWNLLSEIDEDGEEFFAFELEKAREVFGYNLAEEMNEHLQASFAKRNLQEQLNQDLNDGLIQIDEDGNLIDLRESVDEEL